MYTTTTQTIGYAYQYPEVYITKNRNRLKKYENDKFYLNDGDNFEIEIYNPYPNRIAVKIYLNEKSISDNLLVIDAQKRVYIERYIDNNVKFQFKTFEVDDVKETESARNRNGKIRIECFSELKYDITWTNNSSEWNIYNSTGILPNNTLSGTLTSTALYSSNVSNSHLSSKTKKTIETGRIGEGEKSSQKFNKTNGYFSGWPFSSFEFQLFPLSLQPIEVKQIRQYCPECGIRIRKASWKYCPTCGEKL